MASEVFDISQLERGIIHVTYRSTTQKRLKLRVQKGDEQYIYNLDNTGKQETFPLQMGNGSYKISILENTTASKYRLVSSKTITLEMEDPNEVYLNPIQNVYWDKEMEAIQYAKNHVKTVQKPNEKIKHLYEDVVENYTYDYYKLATLPTTYLPFIEQIFKDKTGICYDFSALYASVLRSQGIPVKLVKGYTPHAIGYHAWNEVYNHETGKWMVVDTTYDIQVSKMNLSFKMVKSSKDYEKINEY